MEFDYVIVGGGSAGCVLAARLTEDPATTVLLLEAGPPDRNPWIHLPIGYGKTMRNPRVAWQFHTEPEPQLNGRAIHLPQGRTLGGSSSINGLIYTRGQSQDFDHWASLGNAGWAWRDVLPCFRKSEANSRGADAHHGADGPLHVGDVERHELVEAMIAAAAELGIRRNDDFNGAVQEGAGYVQLTTRNGLRCSTAVGYLRPARARPNLTVKTQAAVQALVIEGGRTTGVYGVADGRPFTARARREVLLCAGAIQSPKILQLSGIGPAALLRQHGIDLRADLPGVGANLQDHLHVKFMYRCSRPITLNDDLRSWVGKTRIGWRWLMKRQGPLATGVMVGGMFARLMPQAQSPDVQFFLSTMSADLRGAEPHPFSGFTISFYQLRPSSRGQVAIRSKDPGAPPAITMNYLNSAEDRAVALAGALATRRLAAAGALARLVAAEYRPGPEVATEDGLMDYVRSAGTTGFHPSGTCRMGADPMAVVDARLRVHGLAGLRVVDASIMPTIVSANTNAATIMIAEKAAQMIRDDARQAQSPAAS